MTLQRRDFITLLGGAAAAWPLAARAQQPGLPVIGYLDAGLPEASMETLAAMRKGLSETGYVEGRNVAIEYWWAQNQGRDRLRELAADLVRRRVAVILAAQATGALAAKAATTPIPIVFWAAADAVAVGLVDSLSRPGGNLTGVNSLNIGLGAKRFELLHELVPPVMRFGLLVDPGVVGSAAGISEAQTAAAALGRSLDILTASTSSELDRALASFVERKIEAFVVGAGGFFLTRRVQLTTFMIRYALPAMYNNRSFAEIGGLMSYAPDRVEPWRQLGVYVGRILKGDKPAALPVLQPTKFELVINLQSAKLLGIAVPPTLLATADEVIE
jgi:putative ABC transport system substrate-binding protein